MRRGGGSGGRLSPMRGSVQATRAPGSRAPARHARRRRKRSARARSHAAMRDTQPCNHAHSRLLARDSSTEPGACPGSQLPATCCRMPCCRRNRPTRREKKCLRACGPHEAKLAFPPVGGRVTALPFASSQCLIGGCRTAGPDPGMRGLRRALRLDVPSRLAGGETPAVSRGQPRSALLADQVPHRPTSSVSEGLLPCSHARAGRLREPAGGPGPGRT